MYKRIGDSDKTRMEALNELVPAIIDACREHPTLNDRLRLSVIIFSDTAESIVNMVEAAGFNGVPDFDAMGDTSYSSAFKCVKKEIEKACHLLKTDVNVGVYRPTVFFFTDGEPNDSNADRNSTWNDLTSLDFTYRPNFFTFGIGEAKKDIIKDYKSGKNGMVFVQKESSNVADAIKEIIPTLVQSIVSSQIRAGSGGIIIDPNVVKEFDFVDEDD